MASFVLGEVANETTNHWLLFTHVVKSSGKHAANALKRKAITIGGEYTANSGCVYVHP